jgi:L-ascorbate metabolism protein UlaG (beta-lactamase superfamily)
MGLSLLGTIILSLYFFTMYRADRGFYRGPKSDHFDGNKFFNYRQPQPQEKGTVIEYIIAKLTTPSAKWPKQIKVDKAEPKQIISQKQQDILFWLNHASIYMRLSGLNIITDPIWSDYISPIPFFGPKRQAEPGIDFEDMPKIDIVLISHNHYDHLDKHSVQLLNKHHNPIFIVGLGVSKTLKQMGVPTEKIVSLDWQQQFEVQASKNNSTDTVKINFVPAQHFSSRFIDDNNSTLWGGFVIATKQKSVYFAGDTGFNHQQFEDIKNKFSKIDVALLPIGAYKPDSFRNVHMNPEEAVKASLILGSKINIPIHYGTFILSLEDYTDPLADLSQALKNHKLPPDYFTILENGSHIWLNKN